MCKLIVGLKPKNSTKLKLQWIEQRGDKGNGRSPTLQIHSFIHSSSIYKLEYTTDLTEPAYFPQVNIEINQKYNFR